MEVEDEKKPFDTEVDANEDSQPDPDETLMLDQGNGRVWMVRIPKFLMERWAAIDEEDHHLATMRVYNQDVGRNGKSPRILLFLPPNRDDPSAPPPSLVDPSRPKFDYHTDFKTSEPDCYEIDMLNDSAENTIVVAERPKDPTLTVAATAAAATTNTRARTTILTGRVKHECSLRPTFTERYRRQMRERNKHYHTPRRTLLRIEDAGIGRGGINRLSSGVGVGAQNAFSDLVKTKTKPTKGNFERMARMPKNDLLDALFGLFAEKERWGIKMLREKTQQPEAYLKEVLSGIASLHRSGEFNGLWELTDFWKQNTPLHGEASAAAVAAATSSANAAGSGFKTEETGSNGLDDMVLASQDMATPFEDEDDDDDDDMEEVS